MTVRILVGDCRKVLEILPSDSVDCIVTSPPYWGLRSYGTEPQVWGGEAGCAHEWGDVVPGSNRGGSGTPTGRNGRGEGYGRALPKGVFCLHCGAWRGELGQEPTLAVWLQNMVLIFRELRRVLKPSGTCWLNCGDAYASTPNGRSAADTKAAGGDDRTFRDRPRSTVGALKAKQRMMMPARLAIALQDDGWWVRDEIIWHKPNPMPSSVKDRTTPAHEMVYLLTKRARYYYDYVAVMEPMSDVSLARLAQPNVQNQSGGAKQDGYEAEGINKRNGSRRPNEIVKEMADDRRQMRLRRSVWTIATQPMREAHFATFPEALVEPMILAGSGHRGCCVDCGKPWERVVSNRFERQADVSEERGVRESHQHDPSVRWDGSQRGSVIRDTAAWRPACTCGTRQRRPAVVLDPFGGSGTVGLVADRHQRDAILIELNPGYAEIARKRIDAQRSTLFSDVEVKETPDAFDPIQAPGRAGGAGADAGECPAAADGL